MSTELTEIESSRLKECELIIATGLHAFVAVGNALTEIKESGLFKQEFASFDDYCQAKWSMKKDYANKLIRASSVINTLDTIVSNPEILIDTESKARILSKFEPEIQKLIIQDLQENNITEITASFLEGFAKAYLVINSKVKEIKATPLFSFNSESEMIEKAKSLITMPEPQVIEVEVIKEVIIDNSAQLNLLESQNKQLEQSLLKKDSLLSESNRKLSGIEKLEAEKYSLERQLKVTRQEVEKLRELDINEDKVNDTLKRLSEFKQRELEISSIINISTEIIKATVEAKEFFRDHLILLNTITISPEGVRNARNSSNELVFLVEQWLIAFKANFINAQENSLVEIY